MKFVDTEIEEYKCYQYKSPILIKDIYVNKMVLSNKFPFAKKEFKYFIDYKDSEKNKLLSIFRPKINIHKNFFKKNERMHFLI